MEARTIKEFSVKLRMENILKHLGFPPKFQQNNSQRIKRYRSEVRAIQKKIKPLIFPRAIYQAFGYEVLSRKRVLLFDSDTGRKGTLTSSYLIRRNILKFRPEKLVLFVATFGDEILKNTSSEDPQMFYLNAIGSEGAEAVARYVCKLLAWDYGRRRSFRRLSPGYGETTGFDWKISEQRVIFNLLGREKIKEELGVELLDSSENASFLMVPLKTVSGIAFAIKPGQH